MSGVPFIAFCRSLAPVTGWPAVGFAPIINMHSVSFRSTMELVAALVPKVRCKPSAVGEWQERSLAWGRAHAWAIGQPEFVAREPYHP